MTNNIGINFQNIFELNLNLKKCLDKNYSIIYIEKKYKDEGSNIEEVSDDDILLTFEILKNKSAFFDKIKSIDDLKTVKDEFILLYKNFQNNFKDYFGRVEKQLDDKNKESFKVIYGLLKSRSKRFDSSVRKFKPDDSWDLIRIREEFFNVMQPLIKDVIEQISRPIEIGINENSAYEGVVEQLNSYLSNLGIYTNRFDINYRLNEENDDYDSVDIVSGEEDETDDAYKVGRIKSIKSNTYYIGDNKIVCEGKVIIYKPKQK